MLTLEDLKDIFSETKGSLAKRIDFAWLVYSDNTQNEKDQKAALEFLIYAFNIRNLEDINNQLIVLMQKRNAYKNSNPNYVPGKLPKHLSFHPGLTLPKKTKKYEENPNPEVAEAISSGELLDVNNDSKDLDSFCGIRFLTQEERDKQQVHIHEGIFKQDGIMFDTGNMESHAKKGYGACIFNTNGELIIFSHKKMVDKIAHSSWNEGAPLIFAGEIKIENGVLKEITTHSGHYKPTLFNIYRLLEYFSTNGIDVSQTQIVTFVNPRRVLPNLIPIEFISRAYEANLFRTPANQLFKEIDNVLQKNMISITEKIQSYQKGGVMNSLFSYKDQKMGSSLTTERAALAKEFESKLNLFREGMQELSTPFELENRINALKELISEYEAKNNVLSKKFNKWENKGRFSASFGLFKANIEETIYSQMKMVP